MSEKRDKLFSDWSQAGISYTSLAKRRFACIVADWSQAGISYTSEAEQTISRGVADWSQAGISYTKLHHLVRVS